MARLIKPNKVISHLNRFKEVESRYDFIENYLESLPSELGGDESDEGWEEWLENPDIPWKNRKVQTYTHGLDDLYNEMIHALFNGMTGSGKTTLLTAILRVFLDRGDYVLYRDDGKKEFRYLTYFFPDETRIFIPDEKQCNLELYGIKQEPEIVRYSSPQEIVDATYQFDKQFNVIVYDPYARPGPDGWKMKSDFYGMLFEYLLLKVQGLRDSKKKHLIFTIDELNDLIPPRGKGITTGYIRAAIDADIRKLRGHKIQLFGSTHRFNQISVDTRSQMKNIFLKQAYGYDSYTFLSRNLISASAQTFWGLIKKISQMPEHIYLLFDKKRNFDLCTFPDIPRPKGLECECTGTLNQPQNKTNEINNRRMQIAYYYGKGLKYREINEITGYENHIIKNDINTLLVEGVIPGRNKT